MQLVRKWLARLRFQRERGVLERRGVWGDTPETLEYLLESLPADELKRVELRTLKRTRLFTRTPSIDDLLMIVRRARYVVYEEDDVVAEEFARMSNFERSLDEYLVTVTDAPIEPVEALAGIEEELKPFLESIQLMRSEDHPRLEYYRRHYHWLFVELRETLQALARAIDPALRF